MTASSEDIHYKQYVIQKIDRGLQDVKEGRVYSTTEMERRFAKWLDR